jgi:hypothetical protein
MSISLGLFDLFTYIVPGSLYLALVAYVADRLGWIGIGQFKDVPSLVLFGGIVIASYLLGFLILRLLKPARPNPGPPS